MLSRVARLRPKSAGPGEWNSSARSVCAGARVCGWVRVYSPAGKVAYEAREGYGGQPAAQVGPEAEARSEARVGVEDRQPQHLPHTPTHSPAASLSARRGAAVTDQTRPGIEGGRPTSNSLPDRQSSI
jgi:hypothetical protein